MDTTLLQTELTMLSKFQCSENTLKSYACDWSLFERWCAAVDRASLPATGETVALYITQQISEHHRLATARCRISAIRYYHRMADLPLPGTDLVRAVMTGAARKLKERPQYKQALSLDELRLICEIEPVTPLDIRNRAVLLFGFAAALRRSEIARMELSDVEFMPRGMLISLRWEKQDQVGLGREIPVCAGNGKTCPVAALRAWIRLRGDKPGYLFYRFLTKTKMTERPFTGEVIAKLVQEEVTRVGLDARGYGGHSLRAGFITAAGLVGASEMIIARHTGHKSLQILRRYFRPRDPFEGAVSGLIGL